jgi:Flp pilus assembly protein TadD
MAKPTPVTFPFLLLLLDWWPLGRWAPRRVPGAPLAGLLPPLRLWAEKIPLFLLAVASSAITVHVQAREGALVGTGSLPMPVRAANAAISYVRYLGKTVLPTDLSAFYPHPSLLPPWWQWAGAILLLAAVSLLAARTARSRPWLAVGWLWYLGTLVPMIGLVQVGGQAMADRYAYLPIAGLFIAAAWEAARAVCGRRTAPTAALAAAVVLLAAGASARQAALWRDTTTLFRHALAVTPPARPGAPPNPTLAMLHNSLGVALAGEGRLAEAIEQYRLALAANPDFGESLNNLGRALEDQGRPDEAAPLYERARESDRLNGEARSNLGLVMLARGRFADAAALFRETLAIDPVHWTATNNLPVALASLGRAGEADAAFRRAVALDPRYPVGRMNYGRFLLAQGRPGEAELQLREALRLEPGLAPAHALLGDALARLGRSAEARASFRQALALAPGLWEARIGLELLERGPAPGR